MMERIWQREGVERPSSAPHLTPPPKPPPTIPVSQPLLLTGKLWSKRCVIKRQSKQDLFGCVMGLAGESWGCGGQFGDE